MGKKLIKKICCIFLAVVLCVPLVFLTACEENDENNKPTITVSYKPYAGLTIENSSDTYGEKMYQNIVNLSGEILSELIFNFEDGVDKKPSLNGVNLRALLGLNHLELESNVREFAKKLNKMKYTSFESEISIDGLQEFSELLPKNILTLSKDGSGLTLGDICGFLVRLNPTNELLMSAIELMGVTIPDIDFIYSNTTDNEYILETENCLIFIGGKVNSNVYTPTGSEGNYNYSNTVNFITKLMNTNYYVVEKDFIGVNFGGSLYSQGDFVNLTFKNWNYNLFNNDLSLLENYSIDEYLEEYLNQFRLKFAIEVAKVLLVGKESLPNSLITISSRDIPTNFLVTAGQFNLLNLYNLAKNGSSLDKQKFIEVASVFCDHYGLLKDDAGNLYEIIKSEVIGSSAFLSETSNNYKNNYETFIKFGNYLENEVEKPSILKLVFSENSEQAVLEFVSKNNASLLENLTIDGYINSFIIYVKEDVNVDVSMFSLEVNKKADFEPDYIMLVRNFDGNNENKGYYTEVNEEFDDGIMFDTSDVLGNNKISKCTQSIDCNSFTYNKNDFEADNNIFYRGWCLNFVEPFLEVVLATPNMFCLNDFDIEFVSFAIE